jgi:hypothetical protein
MGRRSARACSAAYREMHHFRDEGLADTVRYALRTPQSGLH